MKSTDRLRVLIPVQWYEPVGGIEVFLQNLLPGLVERFDVALAVQFVNTRATTLPVPDEVTVYELPLHAHWRQLRAVLDDFRPDVIHLQAASLGWLRLVWLARQRGLPVVWTLHQAPEQLVWGATWAASPIWWGYHLLATHCCKVTGPSAFIVQSAARHGIMAQAISCGVDTQRFHRARDREQELARDALGLPRDLPLVLFVGRLSREKNGARFLRAIELLSRRTSFLLVLVGPPTDPNRHSPILRHTLRRLLDARVVHLAGSIAHDDPRLPLYFRSVDVFALPSLFETQSIATVEALASGLPVLASNRSALPDLVHPGINGRLCDPTDIHDIADQLGQLLASQLPPVAVGAEHRPESVSAQYSCLYAEATTTKKRPRRSVFGVSHEH